MKPRTEQRFQSVGATPVVPAFALVLALLVSTIVYADGNNESEPSAAPVESESNEQTFVAEGAPEGENAQVEETQQAEESAEPMGEQVDLQRQIQIISGHGEVAIVAELEARGYEILSRTRSLLGRIRIQAQSETHRREIVLHQSTGAILSDAVVEVFVTGRASTELVSGREGNEAREVEFHSVIVESPSGSAAIGAGEALGSAGASGSIEGTIGIGN